MLWGRMQAAADQGKDGGMEEDGNIMLLLDAAKELHESGDHTQDGKHPRVAPCLEAAFC